MLTAIAFKSLGEVLSENNLRLLRIIDEEKPSSIKELAEITHRQPGNLSRTLRTMERYGIIEFKKVVKIQDPLPKHLDLILNITHLIFYQPKN